MTEVEVERLVVRLIGDSSSYQKMMNEAGKAVNQTTKTVKDHTSGLVGFNTQINKITGSIKGWALAAGGLVGITGLMGTATWAVTLASDLEQTQIAFETFLGDAGKAKEMLKEIQDYAAKTPFEQVGIRESAKMLLNYGVAAEKVIPTIKMLGEAAAGQQNKMDIFAYNYGQMVSKGHLDASDLRSFNLAGFNPLQEMSRTSGKSVDYFMAQMHNGAISLKMVEDAFASASAKGGRFYGLMEKQSKSLGGLFSTLKDDLKDNLTIIGQELIDSLQLKDIVAGASNYIKEYAGVIVDGIRTVIQWVKPMAMSLWKWLTADGGVTASITAVVTILATMIGPLSIAASFVVGFFSPWMLAIPIVTGMLSWLIESVGGVGAAFELLKPIAIEALNVIVAGIQALGVIFQEAFSLMQTVAAEVWAAIGGDSIGTIKDVQSMFVSLMIMVEFGLQNIGRIWDVTWINMQYQATKAMNEVIYFFVEGLPAVMDFFAKNWNDIWFTAGDFVMTVFINLGKNIRNIMSSIWEYIKSGGTKALSLAWTPLLNGVVNTIKKMPDLPERVIGDLEKELKTQAESMNESLGIDFNIFHEMRMNELLPPDLVDPLKDAAKEADKAAAKIGDTLGNTIGKGIKAAHPFDAAIVGSKEALQHIAEYREGLINKSPQAAAQKPVEKTNEKLDKLIEQTERLIQVNKDYLGEPPIVINTTGLI